MSQSVAGHLPIPRRPGAWRLALYAVLIAGACLRFYRLDSQSYWLDEVWTLEIACGHDADHQLMPVDQVLDHPPDLTGLAAARPVWRVWTGMDRVTGPPGYYLLLRCWMDLFGQGEASLRSLSALLSLAALVMFAWAVSLAMSPEAAIWACAIGAIAGPQIHYAQDARPYALLLFEAAVALQAIVKISTNGPTPRRSMLLILASLCLLFTHYFAISVVFAMALLGMLRTSSYIRNNILACLTIAMGLFAVIWGHFIVRQMPMFSTADRAAAFLIEAVQDHDLQTGWRVLAMPMSMLSDIRPIPLWYALGAVWYLLGAKLLQHKVNRLWPLLYLSVVGLLAALDIANSTAHLAYIRYALLASPAVYAVLAGSIETHPVTGRAVCVAAVAFCAVSLPRAYSQSNEDFRSFGRAISATTQKDDLIVFAGPAKTYAPQILYLAACHYARPLPGPVVLIQAPATPRLMAQLKSRKEIWLAADPAVNSARVWLPGYHMVAGKSWPEVGSLLEMRRDQ